MLSSYAKRVVKKISCIVVLSLLVQLFAGLAMPRAEKAMEALQGSRVLAAAVASGAGVVASGAGAVATGDSVNAVGQDGIEVGTEIRLVANVQNKFTFGKQGYPITYRYTTSARDSVYQQVRIATNSLSKFTVRLFDAEKNFIKGEKNISNNDVWRLSLAKNTTYFLVVSGNPTVAGSIMMTEVPDDYGNTFASSSPINLNSPYSQECEVAGDYDLVHFTTAAMDSNYSLNLEVISGTSGTYEVYDKTGKKTKYCGEIGNKDQSISMNLAANTRYYIRFWSKEARRKLIVKVVQSAKRYTIKYYTNGGKNASGNPTYYVSNSKQFSIKNATRAGYYFLGWYKENTFHNKVTAMVGSMRQNVNLYARWSKVSTYGTSNPVLSSKKKGKLTVKWTASKCSGYRVIYGKKYALGKGSVTKYTKKTALNFKNLTQGVYYYVKIDSYCVDSTGAKVFGPASGTMRMMIKGKKITKKKTTKKKK